MAFKDVFTRQNAGFAALAACFAVASATGCNVDRAGSMRRAEDSPSEEQNKHDRKTVEPKKNLPLPEANEKAPGKAANDLAEKPKQDLPSPETNEKPTDAPADDINNNVGRIVGYDKRKCLVEIFYPDYTDQVTAYDFRNNRTYEYDAVDARTGQFNMLFLQPFRDLGDEQKEEALTLGRKYLPLGCLDASKTVLTTPVPARKASKTAPNLPNA